VQKRILYKSLQFRVLGSIFSVRVYVSNCVRSSL